MSGVMGIVISDTKPSIENVIIRNEWWFRNWECRINNSISNVKEKCLIMLNKGNKMCVKGTVLGYCIVWRNGGINRKQVESICIKQGG